VLQDLPDKFLKMFSECLHFTQSHLKCDVNLVSRIRPKNLTLRTNGREEQSEGGVWM